jgi:hypothetical protein
MSEIEVVYGKFRVWLKRFLPGASEQDARLVQVPLDEVVSRYVEQTRQPHLKGRLLNRWRKELQEVMTQNGVKSEIQDFIALDGSVWNRA